MAANHDVNSRSAVTLAVLATISLCVGYAALGGDDASGNIQYGVDLSRPFTTYTMSPQDKEWSQSLLRNLHYTGAAVHFVRTSLPLRC